MYRTNPNKVQLKANPAPKLRTLKRKLIVWWYLNFSFLIIEKRLFKKIIKFEKELIKISNNLNFQIKKYNNLIDFEIQTKKYK